MFNILLFVILGLYFLPYIITPHYNYFLEGFLLTVFYSCSFLFPIFILEGHKKKYIPYRIINGERMRLVLVFLMGLIGIGIIATFHNSEISDFPPNSLRDVIAVSAESAGRRYKGDVSVSFFGKIGMISCYLLAILFGLYMFLSEKRYKLIIIGWLLILVLAIILGSKAILLYSLVLFIANYVVLLPHCNNNIKQVKYSHLAYRAFTLLLLIFIFFMMMQAMRYSMPISEAFLLLVPQFLSYAQGHVAGFHHFLMIEYNELRPLFGGSQTFYGIFELLQVPVTSNYIDSPKVIGPETTTNVDTILRDLILDFGIFGSGLLLFSFACFFSFLSFNAVCNRIFLGFRTGVVSVLMWSFTNSILTYGTIIIALIINSIFLIYFLTNR